MSLASPPAHRRQHPGSRRHDGLALGGAAGRSGTGGSAAFAPEPTSKRRIATAITSLYLASVNGSAADDREAAEGRRRRQRGGARRRDGADDRRAHRQRRGRARAAGARRRRRCARELARPDRADVGGGAEPSRDGARAARPWRRHQCAFRRSELGTAEYAEPREKWLPPGGLTPLLFAARQGSLESARVLVEAGRRPERDRSGWDRAPCCRRSSTAITMSPVSCSRRARDPNLADKDGRTALFAAVDMNTMPVSNVPMPNVFENQLTSLDLIDRLLARGANVNAQLTSPSRLIDRSSIAGTDTVLTTGSTPLLRAAKAADVAAMRLLLEKGADPKLATRAGVNSADDCRWCRHERGRHDGTQQEGTRHHRSNRRCCSTRALQTMPAAPSMPPTTRAAPRCTAPPCRATIRSSGFWPIVARRSTSRTSADSRRSMSRWDSPAASDSTEGPAIRTKAQPRCCVNCWPRSAAR